MESTPSKNVFDFWIDDVKYTVNNNNVNNAIHLEGTKKDRVIGVQVVNKVGSKLPATGSPWSALLSIGGMAIMCIAMTRIFKKKEQ